jgi:hypothetical protein
VTVLLQPACDALHAVGKAVGFVASGAKSVIGTISDSVMSGITNFIVNGAVWFVTRIADAIDSSTSVDVMSRWFGERYRVMAGIAAAFTLLFLLLSCAATLLHRDPARLGRAVAMVAAAGLGTFAATTIVQLLVVASDQMSALLASNIAGDLHRALTGAAHGLTTLTVATGGVVAPPLFAALIAGFLTAIAALVIWIELLLREVAIYATLLFFPLALAGLVWSASSHWARRLAEMRTALNSPARGRLGASSPEFQDVPLLREALEYPVLLKRANRLANPGLARGSVVHAEDVKHVIDQFGRGLLHYQRDQVVANGGSSWRKTSTAAAPTSSRAARRLHSQKDAAAMMRNARS